MTSSDKNDDLVRKVAYCVQHHVIDLKATLLKGSYERLEG
jgi:hypothetical protein